MLEWSDTYLVGVDRIDCEHEAFFCLVRDFEKAVLDKADKQTLLSILDEVVLYAKFHFRSEENVMESIHYPELEDHKLKHIELIDSLSNKIIGLTIDSISAKDVQDFLVSWFLTHTTDYDRKIAAFLKEPLS